MSNKNRIFYIILILWITIDLLTKNLASTYLNEKINIIWGFFYLKFVENTWITFWIQIPLIKIITIILIIWIFWYYFKQFRQIKNNLIDISFALILAWAIGNGYERIFNSKVIDFIWIKYFSIFNLADIFITLWAILIGYYIIINKD